LHLPHLNGIIDTLHLVQKYIRDDEYIYQYQRKMFLKTTMSPKVSSSAVDEESDEESDDGPSLIMVHVDDEWDDGRRGGQSRKHAKRLHQLHSQRQGREQRKNGSVDGVADKKNVEDSSIFKLESRTIAFHRSDRKQDLLKP
jgi:hypothetical protein